MKIHLHLRCPLLRRTKDHDLGLMSFPGAPTHPRWEPSFQEALLTDTLGDVLHVMGLHAEHPKVLGTAVALLHSLSRTKELRVRTCKDVHTQAGLWAVSGSPQCR
jgi:hypothetical protein